MSASLLTRPELLRSLADLIARARHTNSICPAHLRDDLFEADAALAEQQAQVAEQIDRLMAGRYLQHNAKRRPLVADIHGLTGQWGRWRTTRMS